MFSNINKEGRFISEIIEDISGPRESGASGTGTPSISDNLVAIGLRLSLSSKIPPGLPR